MTKGIYVRTAKHKRTLNKAQRKRKQIEWITNKDGCNICISHYKNPQGYPLIWRNGRWTYVSHFIYEKFRGSILAGMIIRHRCDNPACINPLHLRSGTQKDNIQDCIKRGRFPDLKGEKNGSAKLNEKQIREILIDATHAQWQLAKIYGVSQGTISRIKTCRTWRHIK